MLGGRCVGRRKERRSELRGRGGGGEGEGLVGIEPSGRFNSAF